MTTLFNMGRDMNGYCAFAPVFSDTKYSMVLLAGIPQSFVTPTDYENFIVLFSYSPGISIWVSITGTATFPSAPIAPSNSELNPACRIIPAGTTVSLNTNDLTADPVGISIYALPN